MTKSSVVLEIEGDVRPTIFSGSFSAFDILFFCIYTYIYIYVFLNMYQVVCACRWR